MNTFIINKIGFHVINSQSDIYEIIYAMLFKYIFQVFMNFAFICISTEVPEITRNKLGTRQLRGKDLPCWKRPDKVELTRQNQTGVIHASEAVSENV